MNTHLTLLQVIKTRLQLIGQFGTSGGENDKHIFKVKSNMEM